MPRTLELARAITDKGIEFNVLPAWEDPDKVTDDLIQGRAEEIVQLVINLSKNGSVNDALLEMLRVSQVMPQSDATHEAYVRKFGEQPAIAPSNGHGPDDVAPDGTALGQSASTQTSPPPAPSEAQNALSGKQASSAFVGSPEPAKEAAPSGGDEMPSIDDIYPGYDDAEVADIKSLILASAASGDLKPAEWDRIKAYEAAHEERPEILGLVPVFKAPEPVPQSLVEAAALTPQEIAAADALAAAAGVERQQPEVATWHERPDGATEYRVPTGHHAPEALNEVAGVEDIYDGKAPTRAQQEQLAIPGTPDGTPPMLPIDITTTGDAELSQLATSFHNHFARAQWLLSQEDARERMAEHLEREAERDAFVSAYALHKERIPEDKQHQPTALEAARKQAEHDAEMAEPVRTWRSRKIRHAVDARELKALAAIFDKAVWRINEELQRRARLVTTRPSS